MDSTNNSSSLQSSSGGGGDVEEFDSRSLFAAAAGINNTSVTNTNSSCSNSINNNNHLHFFDSLSFLDPHSSSSSSFPLPNPPTQTPAPASAPKNSKKRSRASRRAPTTVLTTDTSNFRAMVQEFTGIPAPPFSSTGSAFYSSYPRSRFDFFNPTINAAAASASPSPSFLLKPYPQKFQVPNINASSGTNRSSRNSNNTVIPSPTRFNYQSPILNFQSLLQSQLAATADLGLKAQQQPMMMPSTSTSTEYGVADLGLPGLLGSCWEQDASVDPTQLRQEVTNFCKLNFSAAAEFGAAEKGGEARGEGMVESWICSSD